MNSITAASELNPRSHNKTPLLLPQAQKPPPQKHYSTTRNTHSFSFKTNPIVCSTILQSLKHQNHDPLRFFHNPRSNFAAKCSFNHQASGEDLNFPRNGDQPLEGKNSEGFFSKWKANSAEMSSMLAKLGLAAVLAYGLFDGVTYTSFFILAFLGYEKSTGKNPAANLQALLGIVILMWTGNNVTRPFRVAGAAALAPFIDKGLKKIQKYFNFLNMVYAFALVVSLVASVCFTIVGLLILSRWGK